MKILAIRTDKPEAELYLYDGSKKITDTKWLAHLKLAETLNSKIEEMLNETNISYESLEGIAMFKGPGSFTGLRIGMSVANTLAYSQGIAIVASGGDHWLEDSIEALNKGMDDKIAMPEYGAPPRTTKPRK